MPAQATGSGNLHAATRTPASIINRAESGGRGLDASRKRCGYPLTFRDRLAGISVTASGQTPMAAHTVTRLRTGAGICWLA
jgi:hypothetical protein